ncbi:MAG: ABC transporter permease [Solirubrobacteraceae bacterium]
MNNAPLPARSSGRAIRRVRTLPPSLIVGSFLLLLILVPALLAPWLTAHDPFTQNLALRLQAPSLGHPCGTDGLGRDVLSRLLYGARATLGLATLVALFMVPSGLAVGILAGYVGGWLDRLLTAVTNLVMAFPTLVLALAFVGVLGPGLLNCALALMLTGWPTYARLARAETRILRRSEYLDAARMQGIVGARLLAGHVLPACLPTMQVRLALDLASIILAASAFGFLGLGVRPPTPEWGAMIADGSRVLFEQWWIAAFPGFLIFVASLAFNLAAEGLRDYGDPRDAT